MRRRQEGKRRPRWDDMINMTKYTRTMQTNSRGMNTTPTRGNMSPSDSQTMDQATGLVCPRNLNSMMTVMHADLNMPPAALLNPRAHEQPPTAPPHPPPMT